MTFGLLLDPRLREDDLIKTSLIHGTGVGFRTCRLSTLNSQPSTLISTFALLQPCLRARHRFLNRLALGPFGGGFP